jgi:hypothetical protein
MIENVGEYLNWTTCHIPLLLYHHANPQQLGGSKAVALAVILIVANEKIHSHL